MNRFENLLKLSKDFYDNGDPSHDWSHIERVMLSCRTLATHEAANLEILLPAAVLHDVLNVPKNHEDRAKASELAAARARHLLISCAYTESEIEHITTVITEHSYSRALKPTSIESALLQDADKIDALGAIGIMRTVTCGVLMNCRYYHPGSMVPKGRELDDKAFTIDHFFVKLLKLPERMHTVSGRTEAERRRGFMTTFLRQLQSEVQPGVQSSVQSGALGEIDINFSEPTLLPSSLSD